MPQTSGTAISVVIPARNESANIAELVPEIAAALGDIDHEILVVDDGSSDDTAATVDSLGDKGFRVRRIVHKRSLGQSAALMSGVRAATLPIVATLDGDGQNDPQFLPEMVAKFADPKVGLVAGQRVGRKATFSKRMGSRVANRLRRGLLKDDTRDTGCGIKAFRRRAYLNLPYFEHMHRFLPALFLGDGWQIAHVDVIDRPRVHGKSNYGTLDRLLVGIPDLFGVWWLLRRRRRNPLSAEHDVP